MHQSTCLDNHQKLSQPNLPSEQMDHPVNLSVPTWGLGLGRLRSASAEKGDALTSCFVGSLFRLRSSIGVPPGGGAPAAGPSGGRAWERGLEEAEPICRKENGV